MFSSLCPSTLRGGLPLAKSGLACLAMLVCLSSQAIGQTVKTSFYYNGGNSSAIDLDTLAKYDVFFAVNRFIHNDVGDLADGSLWTELKNRNADMEIYIGQNAVENLFNSGPTTAVNLGEISRDNKNDGFGDRGHSQGDILNDNPSFYLKNGGANMIAGDFNLLDWGNSDFSDYWVEATDADIASTTYAADGILAQKAFFSYSDRNDLGGYAVGDMPDLYPTSVDWNTAMSGHLQRIRDGLAGLTTSQKTAAEISRFGVDDASANGLIDLDTSGSGDLIALHRQFAGDEFWLGEVNLYGGDEWLRTVNTTNQLTTTDMAFQMTAEFTSLAEVGRSSLQTFHDMDGSTGTTTTGEDAFYYGLGSYLAARGSTELYFSYIPGGDNTTVTWFDEYDKLSQLGDPLDTEMVEVVVDEMGTANTISVYKRTYQFGYVYVNPNLPLLVEDDVDETLLNFAEGITLPSGAKRITNAVINDDWSLLPDVTTFGLDPQRAAIFYEPDGAIIPGGGLNGDFNEDGVVDAADYTTWRDAEGTGATLPNDDGIGGTIGAAHYNLWRSNFGMSAPAMAPGVSPSHHVPEPTSLVLLGSLLAGLIGVRSSRGKEAQA